MTNLRRLRGNFATQAFSEFAVNSMMKIFLIAIVMTVWQSKNRNSLRQVKYANTKQEDTGFETGQYMMAFLISNWKRVS